MTNERAVEILNLDLDILGQYGGETAEAYKMAIQALEAQPCEDCISREAVLEGLANIAKAKAKSDAQKSMMGRCMFFVEQLPPVTPKYTDEEIDRTQAVEQAYVDKMVELAVEETKRPKGKWIYKTRIKGNPYIYECSVCNECHRDRFKYCPNCGAYMGGGEDDLKT